MSMLQTLESGNTAGRPGRHALTILPRVLRDLSPAGQRKICENSYVTSVQKGELLVRTGQIHQGMIIVQSGWLAADIDDVCVAILPPNSFYVLNLGASVRPAVCNLRAVSSNTNIAAVDRDTLGAVLAESPDVLFAICDALVQRLGKHLSDTAKRITEPLELRLAGFLWSIGIPVSDGSRRIPSVIPQPYIASYLGSSREEISRKRQLLIRSGYLSKRDTEWFMEPLPGMALS
jgi:CRP-like cAMP-binding protein